ncbi:MAG: LptF/LptG family permease [Pirellulaceae bacterium]
MRATITRYVAWDLLRVFAQSLAMLTAFFLLILIGTEAQRMNLGPGPTVQIMQYTLPMALAFSIPAASLFAVCFVYGRLSADNEVVAVKSLGISPMSLLWPGFALAFVLSLIAVWVNNVAYSWGQTGMQRVVIQSVEEIAYRLLRSQKSYSNPRFSIVVRDVQDRTLIRPIISFQQNNDMPPCTVTAAEAQICSNLDRGTLTLILRDYEIDTGDGTGFVMKDSGELRRELPLAFASVKEQRTGSPQQMPLSQIPGAIDQQREEILRLQQALAAEVGFELLSGDLDALGSSVWESKRLAIIDAQSRLHRLRTEPWRRWASGFSCLAFVLLGAPLAIRFRNSDYISTFGMCFFPILVGYYPLLMYGIDQAKAGNLPPYSVWLANLVCGGVGLFFIRRVIRY